jgi:phage replication O-like protein O
MLMIPNHTQVPNGFIDEYMQKLSGAASKVFLSICRKTIGWHKLTDKISYKQLCRITGMTDKSVTSAIEELLEMKMIRAEKAKGKTTAYEILFDEQGDYRKNSGSGTGKTPVVYRKNSGSTTGKIPVTKETLKETKQKKSFPSPSQEKHQDRQAAIHGLRQVLRGIPGGDAIVAQIEAREEKRA